MLLIASGAYIDNEFVAEFGLLPPSFLPIGNRRLYEYQIEHFQSEVADIWLSIPDDFELQEYDIAYFKRNKINIIKVPKNLSLGASIIYAWNSELCGFDNLQILHGDTLVMDSDLGKLDYIATATNEGVYERAIAHDYSQPGKPTSTRLAEDGEIVLAGYFSIAKPNEFVSCITKKNYNFIAGLNAYKETNKLHYGYCEKWLDFGHINTYHRSKAFITTQRSFNSMLITNKIVKKSSAKKNKMLGEAHWFYSLPNELKRYCPHTFGSFETEKSAGYQLEYLYLSSLSDLFVFAKLSSSIWRSIFRSINRFTQECLAHPSNDIKLSFDDLYLEKTLSRLSLFNKSSEFDITRTITFNGQVMPSLVDMAKRTDLIIRKNDVKPTVVHGDLCFSNILYDFRVRDIKVIDPRGIDSNGQATIFGEARYDLSKLYHSVIGLYDLIVAKRFEINKISDYEFTFDILNEAMYKPIQNEFLSTFLNNSEVESELLAINVHLFLSMLPLHDDNKDRQLALLLNGCRMYSKLSKYTKL